MASKKSSGMWKWVLALLVAGGVGGGWWHKKKQAQDKPVDYKTTVVSRGDIIQAVSANGQISPVKSVQVGSQISGIIQDLFVDFNSVVTNGQIIAQIDPSTYQQNLTQAEAELANAMAGLEMEQLNFKRSAMLRTNELISTAEHERAEAQLHQSEAIVRTRQASVNRNKVDLSRTTIYAPINGVVISRNVDVGQTVAASFSTPTLFLIANDLAKMQIEAMVSETDIGGVDVGQKVNFNVDAFPSRSFLGLVKQVRYAPTTNQNVVYYTAVVEVDNADLRLRPGMTAGASIVTAQKSGVLRIANAALRFKPPETSKSTNNPAVKPGSPTKTSITESNTTVASVPAAGGGDGGGSSSREEMRKRFESMSPEDRERMRERMRSRGGGEGGGGGFGRQSGGPRASQEGPITRTVYVVDKSSDQSGKGVVLQPVTIKTGVSDGSFTEVISGLDEGAVVATGLNLPALATGPATAGTSPFGGPFGGRSGGGGGRGPR